MLENSLNALPHKIIYRIFGPGELSDKVRERKIYRKLCAADLAPHTYGESERERLEVYLEGYMHMPASTFTESDIIQSMCRRLKRLQSVDMTSVLGGEGLMIDMNIEKWRKAALAKMEMFENHENFGEVAELLSGEIWDMYNEVVPRDSPVVFSHLDPTPLNFLYNPSTREVCFVDFEYSGLYYRSTILHLFLMRGNLIVYLTSRLIFSFLLIGMRVMKS